MAPRCSTRSSRALAAASLLWILSACATTPGGGGPPNAELKTVAMRVHRLEAMRAFYEEALGFTFREVQTGEVRSLFGDRGGLTLKLVPIRDGVDFEGFAVHQLGFRVPDIEAVIEIAMRHGGRRLEPLLPHADGVTTAVRDPDGNTVELYGPPPPPEPDR